MKRKMPPACGTIPSHQWVTCLVKRVSLPKTQSLSARLHASTQWFTATRISQLVTVNWFTKNG